MKPRFTSGLSASESAIICVSARTSIPSKLLRVMKFATPATASLPYSAEAPSVSISMRSIMIEGATLLMSTKPKPPSVVCRPPFNNTNVARGPSPRKLIVVVGELPMFTAPPPCWVLTVDTEPTFCGRFLNTSAIEPASLEVQLFVVDDGERLRTIGGTLDERARHDDFIVWLSCGRILRENRTHRSSRQAHGNGDSKFVVAQGIHRPPFDIVGGARVSDERNWIFRRGVAPRPRPWTYFCLILVKRAAGRYGLRAATVFYARWGARPHSRLLDEVIIMDPSVFPALRLHTPLRYSR